MSAQITDPADRLNDAAFVKALEKRYERLDGIEPIGLDLDDLAERYGNVCDLIVQLLWADSYGVNADDPVQHTSTRARTIARLIFLAAGIEAEI